MNYAAIDLHKMECQVAIRDRDGKVVEARVPTRRDQLEAVFQKYGQVRVLLEASTESEWVASYLESLGHEVLVADPNHAPMYAYRSPAIKTDRRDARALLEACERGMYKLAHRRSAKQRYVQVQLTVRETLVRSRTRQISVVRAELRRHGWRLRSGAAESFLLRVGELELSQELGHVIAPLLGAIDLMTEQVRELDRELAQAAKGNPLCERLQTAPGVGVITALAFVAGLDQVERFPSARRVRSYLGLVPRERSSGEIQRRGRITKRGNSRVRWLLVEAGWRIQRTLQPRASRLRAWAARVAERRGRRIAAVGLARRLAGILFAMWRDGVEFNPEPRAQRS